MNKPMSESYNHMVKEILKNQIELVPKVVPEPEELEALRAGREDRAMSGTISHEAINWD